MPEQPQTIVINNKRPFKFSYAIIAALLLVIIYLVTCNPTAPKQDTSIADKLIAQKKEDSIRLEAERALNEVAVMNANNRTREAERDRDSAWKIVEGTQSKFAALNKRYAVLREGLPDTGLITVDPDYVLTCDTCFDQLDQSNREVLFYKSKVDKLGESIVAVLAAKDTAIAIEKRAVTFLLNREDEWSASYRKLASINSPRLQLYPIATTTYSPQGFNFGAGAALKLKNDVMIGGMVLTAKEGQTYQLILSKKLSFRKP